MCEDCGATFRHPIAGPDDDHGVPDGITNRYCRQCAARRLFPDRVDLARLSAPEGAAA